MKKLLIFLLFTCSLFGQWWLTPTNLPYYVSSMKFDSIDVFTPNAQFHRMDSLVSDSADGFIDVKWDTLIASETTFGFELGADSTYFLITQGGAGLTRVQGCGHWLWNGSDNATVKIYMRTLVNSDEARCLQSNGTRGRKSGGDGSLDYEGTITIDVGDTVRIQYQVSDADVSWYGSPVFDNPVAFSVNFSKISRKP